MNIKQISSHYRGALVADRATLCGQDVPAVSLYLENTSDPQESVERWLTPVEARDLAAELVRLAAEIEGEG